MRQGISTRVVAAICLLLVASMFGACNQAGTEKAPSATATAAGAKLPITTSSDEAKKQYLEGRDKTERLLIADSLANFDKAIELDPNFALAELARANASQSPKEFFDHLAKAVALADKASEGEKLLIVSTKAGVDGDTAKQKESLDKLVAMFPDDERVQVIVGGYYFGQQDYTKALEHYNKAIQTNANHAPAYNIAGYAYRQNGQMDKAEQSFKKYIELIPKDPNPYDSYAELLMKMGRFDESIEQYRKALAIDPKFIASRQGVAMNLLYGGKPAEATTELEAITTNARNDGDRRTALFAQTVVDVDGGSMDRALADVDKQIAIDEKSNDVQAVAGDLQLKAAILLEMGKADEAGPQFAKALETIEKSSQSQDFKDNAKLQNRYNTASVALAKKDVASAKSDADALLKGATATGNKALVRQAHELAGMIALEEKNYDAAIAELNQASQQDPYNLYRLALAYQGKGDDAKAKEYAKKAADFNGLPQITYAMIRLKAKKMTGS